MNRDPEIVILATRQLMKCPICGDSSDRSGVLCEDCRAELVGPERITPEQIVMHCERPTTAAFLDRWSRQHRIAPEIMIIGRNIESHGFELVEPSVSRRHAWLEQTPDEWLLHDLGSVNGTFVDEQRVDTAARLHTGDRVRFGTLSFFFFEDASTLPAPRFARAISETSPNEVFPAAITQRFERPRLTTLPVVSFELQEPTGGGGGMVHVGRRQVQLTIPQYELMKMMLDRMLAEADEHEHVRGFISASELLANLSLDASVPCDSNVRQLIRRVRRTFMKAEIADVIESRHGLGYRLRLMPRIR